MTVTIDEFPPNCRVQIIDEEFIVTCELCKTTHKGLLEDGWGLMKKWVETHPCRGKQ